MLWLHEEAHLHQIRELIKRRNSLNSIDEALKVTAHLRLAGGTSAGFILINAHRQNVRRCFYTVCRGGATSEQLQNGAFHSWRPRCSPGETHKNDTLESWAASRSSSSHKRTAYTSFDVTAPSKMCDSRAIAPALQLWSSEPKIFLKKLNKYKRIQKLIYAD